MFKRALFSIFLIAAGNFLMAQRFIPLFPEENGYTQNNIVFASFPFDIIEYNGDIVIGGDFDSYLDADQLRNVAVWNGTEMTPFEFELPSAGGDVFKLVNTPVGLVFVGNLSFMQNAGVLQSGEWFPLDSLLNNDVHDVHFDGVDLWIAGRFNQGQNGILNNVGRGFIGFDSLSTGLNDDVNTITSFQDEIYVGGEFELDGLEEDSIKHIAKWNGEDWEQIGSGFNNDVNSLFVFDDKLYIGGRFTETSDGEWMNSLAVYDGQTLSRVFDDTLEIRITKMFEFENELYLTGNLNGNSNLSGTQTLVYNPVTSELRECPRILYGHASAGGKDYFLSYAEQGLPGFGEEVFWMSGSDIIEHEEDGDLFSELQFDQTTYGAAPGAALFYNPLNRRTLTGFDGSNTIFSLMPYVKAVDDNGTHFYQGLDYNDTGLFAYHFGPYSESLDIDYFRKYMRTWSVTKEMIDFHAWHWSDPWYVMPEVIKNWPANGRVEFGESAQMAPYADLNENGIYEPDLGEYTKIFGDQAIYSIINSRRDNISEYETTTEIGVMVYNYLDHPSFLQNTIFVNYEFKNIGVVDYDEFQLGLKTDLDIGNPANDFAGCDTTRNSFFVYNGLSFDTDTVILFNNNTEALSFNGYGSQIPAQGLTFLNKEMSMFRTEVVGDDDLGLSLLERRETFFQMRAEQGDTIYVGGDGINNVRPDSIPAQFMFPSCPTEPITTDTWSFISEGLLPEDRRVTGFIEPFPLAAGEKVCVDIALTNAYALDPEANDSHIQAVGALKNKIDLIQQFYDFNSPEECENDFVASLSELIRSSQDLKVYPNPVDDILYLVGDLSDVLQIRILSTDGQVIKSYDNDLSFNDLDVSELASGTYVIEASGEKGHLFSQLMVKL